MIWWWACAQAPDPPAAPEPPAVERRGVLRRPARRDERWANALCNDGTAFSYAYRPGTEPTWVIALEGGFFCDDEGAPCAQRARRLTTTEPGADDGPARVKDEGIFSMDPASNPSFAGAHAVEAHYCSSDLWLGDTLGRRPTTGDPAQGWFFHGRENVRVLLDAVKAIDGLDEADPATKILVLGTSAGALGVVGNLDQVRAAFPRAAADGRVKVVLDAGWVPPVPGGAPLANGVKWGPIDRACAAREPDDRVCVYGPSWWPAAAATGLPILVQISGLDATQLPSFRIDTPAKRADWLALVRTSLDGVPWVFSAAQPYHAVAIDAERYARFREVLDPFWRGGPPQRVFLDYPEP